MSFLQRLCIFHIILLSHCLTFADFTADQKAEAIRLVREGQSFAKVARKVNANSDAVRRWVRAEEQRTGQQIGPPPQQRQQRRYFTTKQKEKAIRLVRGGRNFSEVARQMNTSQVNVLRWVRSKEERTGQQIGRPKRRQQRRHFTAEQKLEAVHLVRGGQSFAEVAGQMNTSLENVRRWVRSEEQRTGQQIGPPPQQRQQPRSFTVEERAGAIHLVRDGRNFTEVAGEMNTHRETVRRWVRSEEQRTGQQIGPLPRNSLAFSNGDLSADKISYLEEYLGKGDRREGRKKLNQIISKREGLEALILFEYNNNGQTVNRVIDFLENGLHFNQDQVIRLMEDHFSELFVEDLTEATSEEFIEKLMEKAPDICQESLS